MLLTSAVTGFVALTKVNDLVRACPHDECPAGFDYAGARTSARTFVGITDILLVERRAPDRRRSRVVLSPGRLEQGRRRRRARAHERDLHHGGMRSDVPRTTSNEEGSLHPRRSDVRERMLRDHRRRRWASRPRAEHGRDAATLPQPSSCNEDLAMSFNNMYQHENQLFEFVVVDTEQLRSDARHRPPARR